MENVAGEQDLALKATFSIRCINFLHYRGFKLGHFGIFDALFLFLAFFKL